MHLHQKTEHKTMNLHGETEHKNMRLTKPETFDAVMMQDIDAVTQKQTT